MNKDPAITPGYPTRIFSSLVLYAASAFSALVATSLAHRLSGRGIWGVFTGSYRVREMSLYFYNVIPVYLLAFLFVALADRWIFKSRQLNFFRTLTIALLAVPVSMVLHAPLFPWSAHSAVMLALFAVFFASAYAVLGHLASVVSRHVVSFPAAAALRWPLLLAAVIWIAFTGGFRIASDTGMIIEEQTLKPRPWPTRPEYAFTPKQGSTTQPALDLLKAEALPEDVFGGKRYEFTQVLDINGDGYFDIVFKDSERSQITVVINDGGTLRYDEALGRHIEDGPVGNFAFADLNGDGELDIVFDRPRIPVYPKFDSVAFNNIFWNFADNKSGHGVIKQNVPGGPWKDVSEALFPGGLPPVPVKSEPILVFDANGDGRLDFLWSGYSRPRKTMNRIYIQKPNGTFVNELETLLDHSPKEIFPEGSDVGDIDADGDIDFFGFGFLYLNEGGHYRQVCGTAMPGIFCDAVTRNEEGASFVDMDGDGNLDIVMSFHGAGSDIPKYYLQLFRGGPDNNGIPVRDPTFGRAFYGAHYYLRAKDFDFDGKREIILWNESRIVTLNGPTWIDLLPAIAKNIPGITPVSWIDIDEDGDWDILATVGSGKKNYLLRNSLNPERYVKISALGPGGVYNQPGATFKITLPGGRILAESYRPNGGYGGITDPRIVFPVKPGFVYKMNVCFPSLDTPPQTPPNPPGIRFEVIGTKGNCVDYEFFVSDKIKRLDLAVIAGKEGARFKTTEIREP